LLSFSSQSCEIDRDCGVGVCIKREKRASGVCYGLEVPVKKEKSDKKSETPRDQAISLMGDPHIILRKYFPGKAIGKKCVVQSDCNDGTECVHAAFEGYCIEK
jgi:hypothetical protein|tara:strand:+ start:77 stop:385 length:309 start_codon:yes stop_codon:yes gene_type:complete